MEDTFDNDIMETNEELSKCSNNNTPFFNFDNELHLAKVVYCYDGDTLHCIFKHDNKYQKFIIRMYGYDSEEIRQSKSLDEESRQQAKEKAYNARDRLAELVLNKNIYIICKKMDKYGRILAEIKLNLDDKKTINEIMVEEGHGYRYYGGLKK